MPKLRLDSVKIRRKSRFLHENLVALRRRTIESRHEQMEINCQRIHHDNFARKCPNQTRPRIAENLLVRIPGGFSVEVSMNSQPSPVIQFPLDVEAYTLGLQAE